MPDNSETTHTTILEQRLLACLDEVALLRRLVLSMVLNIDIDFMPPDEAAKLREIVGEEP